MKMNGDPVEKAEKDYNPFEHRKVEKPNSDARALANVLKASLGSGLLAMPVAFANAGWSVGIVGTIIIAFICGHCVHIFVDTSRSCCKAERKPLLNYAETCRAAFANGPKSVRRYAKAASVIAELSLFFSYMGVCCIFTVLIAENFKQLFDTYYPVVTLSVQYYCLILLVPMSILTQIRHLKWLAPFSFLANVLLVLTFAICLFYIFKDPISIEGVRAVGHVSRFPAFLSTVIFAIEGIGVVMPVENAMKKPEHFLGCPSVLVIAVGIIIVLYTTLGLFGYFRYGDSVMATITLNLPVNEWPAICAKVFIALSIFLTYPLHFFVVVDIFTKYVNPHVKKQYMDIAQICMRICIVWFCGAVAIALPMMEQIINFVGALFYSSLGLIIPAIVDTVYRWPDLGKYQYILWKNCLIMLFGFICLVSGCAVTIGDIIQNLREQSTV
ncbi:proton-coupled amino acid transporter-like protein pathetic [Leguminivora glycinivorella]|uniref:proton-coupled amino acid transporter-like protein pathetic n=1 Tax=Leguminivora glycinivorella TaxID=1035111 RepID=UPI00200FA75B|nr:proton-coupled amino acid transporter-like protein pathetic [Leguminivora glycinivorella]